MHSLQPELVSKHNDADAQATITALASLDMAIALVDIKTNITCFVSAGLQQLLPHAEVNRRWNDALADEHELLKVSKDALSTTQQKAARKIIVSNSPYSIEFKHVENDKCLVSFAAANHGTENLHQYMQARDSLFSTSRTISVSEMATTLAHEINTPIATITNIIRGVKMRLQKPDTSMQAIDEALSSALEQTQFTQSVINRIRDFTQSRRPKHQTLDIRDQISEAVSLLDWMLGQSQCRVDIRLPEQPVYVVGDATMLQQVLINLLRNAVDAMEGQSPALKNINIHLTSSGTEATVAITDAGVGIDSSQDKLFVPFATNKAGGMGVGLNICRSFVELHQGRLWLSPNDDQGCTSYIELPLAEPMSAGEVPLKEDVNG